MLKKLLTSALVFTMMFGLVGCGSDDSSDDKKEPTTTTKEPEKTEREFTEAPGLIKYFTIEDIKICLPETVGEYVRYLQQLGTKVELGDTGNTVDEAEEMESGEMSSLVAYLKVYLSDDEDDWQWFGIRYQNNTDDTCSVADATVTQISLAYDLYSEHEDKENRSKFKTTVFTLNNDDTITMNGKISYSEIVKTIGAAQQNTDGHVTYTDDQGYKYLMDTENKRGILGEVQITYPSN